MCFEFAGPTPHENPPTLASSLLLLRRLASRYYMYSHWRTSGSKLPGSQLAANHEGRSPHLPQTPHGLGCTPMRGLDDPFSSGSAPATQHGRPPLASLEFSFTPHEFHGMMDIASTPLDSHPLPEDYENENQPDPLSYTLHSPHNGNSGVHGHTPFSSVNGSSRVGRHSETPMDDYQSAIYSAPQSHNTPYHMGTSYECETPSQGLHATVAQLMASIKGLSDTKNNLEIELTRLKEANVSLVARLNVAEKILKELQQKFADTEKSAGSKMSANNHVVLKSIIQPLFSQLCGIDCDASKKNRIAALAAIKPLDNQQPFELSNEATQIWHLNWLSKVDDNLNVKFLKEVGDCMYNNEKMQREQTQIRTIPNKSFSLEIIMECIKTYFRTIHKQEYGWRRGRRITVAAARHKAALQYEKESGHQGAAALIDTDFGSDILTCNDEEQTEAGQSANRVTGHAWRSIDYVAFLRWLSFCAMKQQQEGSDTLTDVDPGPQRKRRRTTMRKPTATKKHAIQDDG
ncbi:hypothetical protein EDC04DRAFT_2602043 [Pisolithus marmoratus]|nr:hypothetical protein EDC04DRAFT_2602043 [Pisolithus marmoratus]